MKRLAAVLLALFAGLALAATVSGVQKKGVLVLGTDPQFAPFEFTNAAGEIVGFDIDIARAVARDLGVRLEVRNVGFGALMPAAVTSGRVDMAMSGITITAERGKVVSFSQPYFKSAQVFIVASGNPKKLAWPATAMTGRTIGAQANTTGQYAAEEKLKPLGATVKIYDDFASGLADVRAGRIDAIVGDAPTVDYLKVQQPGRYAQAGGALQTEDYGIAFSKGSDLAARANAVLARMRANGEYQKLIEKWIVAK